MHACLSLVRRLAGLFVVMSTALSAHAEQPPARPTRSDDVVRVQARASAIQSDGSQDVVLTVTVAPDWYIYANPLTNENFVESMTTLEIAGAQPLQDVRVVYPVGKPKDTRDFGAYAVYEGQVAISARVRRAPGDTGPLKLSLFLQSCNDVKMVCLIPATIKLTVKDK